VWWSGEFVGGCGSGCGRGNGDGDEEAPCLSGFAVLLLKSDRNLKCMFAEAGPM